MSIANLVTKTLISGAIVLGSCVVGAAPAGASTGSTPPPNPFSGLTCNCQEAAPPDSPALKAEIDRGIQQGRSSFPGSAGPGN
jgi:hypothetical protein